MILIGTRAREHGPNSMLRLGLLLIAVFSSACASSPSGRASDHVVGVLVLTGTEQPIVGAQIVLVPVEPLGPNADADPGPEPPQARATTQELGAFVFTTLDAGAAPRPLLRGWLYELHATAPGFYSTTERVRFERGQLALTIEIDVIDDTDLEGTQFVGEQRPDRLQDVDGTLIDEVLRRQGRQPPPGF